MKKLVFAATTLLVLAGSTFTVPMFSAPAAPAVAGKTVVAKPASIPPPVCPYNDPNGCGIYG